MSEKIYSPIIYDPISKIYYKQELNTHTGIVLNPQQQFINKLIKQRDQYKTERDQYKTENENLKHEWDYLDKSLASLQEDYNHLESQHDELFRRYEMLNELI